MLAPANASVCLIRGLPRSSWCWLLLVLLGCGTTKNRTATQQLLVSDAVDQAVASIDFRPLAGKSVFFEVKYIQNVPTAKGIGLGFVNAEYIISSLRQQMLAADCRLEDKVEDAEYIVEARVGTLGSDENEIVYGIPQSNSLSSAALLLPNAPPLPAIPEISLARKHSEVGAVKLAAFAYHRQTKRPVWQSGTSRAASTAQDVWVLGAGPFQQGSVYGGTRFAGEKLRLRKSQGSSDREAIVSYEDEFVFPDPQQEPGLLAPFDEQPATFQVGDEPTASWPPESSPTPQPPDAAK